MDNFETFAEKFERKLFCSASIATIAAGVSIAATAANGISQAVNGGGGAGGMGGGVSAPPPASAVPQSLVSQSNVTAAKSYDPSKDVEAWSNIFTSFAKQDNTDTSSTKTPTIDLPNPVPSAAPNNVPVAGS